MEIVLKECYSCSAPYIDDVVVFSVDGKEHGLHLRKVLEALRTHGLTVNIEKCAFGREQVEYLGHLIGKGEVAVPSHRATAMADFLLPRSKKQLRSFLGAASYYRRFVKGFASYSYKLSPDTSKFAPGVVVWDAAKLEAFHKLKVSLVDVCVLTVPCSEDTFSLHTDASGWGIGATLNVLRNGVELPVAFFSKQLQGAQQHYSATELEGLAIFKAIFYFSHFLWGRHFKVVTDHRALVSLLKSKTLNKRLYGWLLKLLDFSFEVVYRPGVQHQDADALSRQAWSTEDMGAVTEWEPTKQPRTAAVFAVGGDVGMSPTEKAERRERKTD